MTASDSAAPKPVPLTLPQSADLERLRGGLRIIALRALGDPDAADEAVQETLARAVVALADGRLDDPARLAAYVAGIVRHVCSHLHRDRKNTMSLEDADAGKIVGTGLAVRFDPLEALIRAAEAERLRVAFRALSAVDQQLLRLFFHEDRTPAEVATALAEPADRIRKRKSRALARLRRVFLGDAPGHDEPTSGTKKVPPMKLSVS